MRWDIFNAIRLMFEFMPADRSGFAFRQILIEKNAAVSFDDLVEPFQIADFGALRQRPTLSCCIAGRSISGRELARSSPIMWRIS